MRKLIVLVLACVMGTAFGGLALALDPTNPGDALRDEDHDELNNVMEFIYGTDPLNADTDADLVPDGWEAYYDMNRAQFPVDSQWARYDADGDGVNDINVDPLYKFDPAEKNAGDMADQDGWDTLKEYQIGTDPTNPDTDGDGRMDDVDPNPLIPDPKEGPGGGGNSGMSQGAGMGITMSVSWDSFVLRGF